jgi:23S rRNA (cytosine1962-C5)-methyltransferase
LSFEPGVFDRSVAVEAGANALTRSLAQAHARRAELARQCDCYRLHDAEADTISGLTVERYGDFAVVHAYSPEIERKQQEIARALCSLGAVGVYLKVRRRGDLRKLLSPSGSDAPPLAGSPAPHEFTVNEQGRRYLVRLGEGIATGLFVDQRDNREHLQHDCRGQRVLNLFCYTGSFSVAAGLGGAAQVTSVDSSRAALSRVDANLRCNGLDPAQHRLLRADAPDWLARAARRGERFDFVVLDPPTFSSSSNTKAFSAEQQYRALVKSCLGLCRSGARLLCVTNHRGTSDADLTRTLARAAAEARVELSRVSTLAPPPDCARRRSNQSGAKSLLATVR